MSHLPDCGPGYCATGCPEYPAIAAAMKRRTASASAVTATPDHEQAERIVQQLRTNPNAYGWTEDERILARAYLDFAARLDEAQRERDNARHSAANLADKCDEYAVALSEAQRENERLHVIGEQVLLATRGKDWAMQAGALLRLEEALAASSTPRDSG